MGSRSDSDTMLKNSKSNAKDLRERRYESTEKFVGNELNETEKWGILGLYV